MSHPRRAVIVALLVAAWSPGIPAAEAPFAEPESAEPRIEAVNDGELSFLSAPPAEPVHHHINHITISHQSLDDGWVALRQCHRNLDPVPRLEVIFHPTRIRDLAVVVSKGIGRAWVEGSSVQLEGVGRGAQLCISAGSRALSTQADGTLVLHNGPYMRKFLDGYYPMRITTEITLPQDAVEVFGITPPAQPGFEVKVAENHVLYDGWFEGRLETDLVLVRR